MQAIPKEFMPKSSRRRWGSNGDLIGFKTGSERDQNASFVGLRNGLRRSLSHGVFAAFTLWNHVALCGHRLPVRSELPLMGASR